MKKQDKAGEPLSYKQLPKEKSIKSIRGIYRLWTKAQKFGLRLDAVVLPRMYVHKDGKGLTPDRKEAKRFAHGFDNPELKKSFWMDRLSTKLIVENL